MALDEHCFNKIVIAPTVVPKNQNFVGIREVLLSALSEGKENVGRV